MKKFKMPNIVIPLIISLLISALVYFLINSILYTLAYEILLVVGILYVLKQKKKNDKLYKNIEASYNFTNLMNIAMLNSGSIYEAYKSIEAHIDSDFVNIASEDIQVQLAEIAESYNLTSFKMYINTLILFDNEGGNFKEMSMIPANLTLKAKVYYNKLLANKLVKLVEISTLYFMWLLILVFMKVSITTYYDLMLSSSLYQLIYFAILMIGSSIYLLSLNEFFKNKIRGM